MVIERFAPSPTGPLHLGHAYSAHLAWRAARAAKGQFLLRLEDLDAARVRPEYAKGIEMDLAWLGLDWDGAVLHQSRRGAAYATALAWLTELRVVFTCTCSRRDIRDAASAPQEGVAHGPDGPVYPGTCRERGHALGPGRALRLDMRRAIAVLGGVDEVSRLAFEEIGTGPAAETGVIALDPTTLVDAVGDIVLARRDGAVAYHLAVVVDDAFQRVTHVTRGADLFSATPIHRLLQALLGLPTPVYRHHALVRDETGKRLAKRDDARAIARYRDDGLTAEEVLDHARIATGLGSGAARQSCC
ncbi:MAG: tRNA glutamyl-Q(34) synthetase GluQRS [Pseudomonadota bacterium]